jgi:hypothetical protein
VILAPSERVVVDLQFTDPGVIEVEYHTPDRVYPPAEITVTAARRLDLTDGDPNDHFGEHAVDPARPGSGTTGSTGGAGSVIR